MSRRSSPPLFVHLHHLNCVQLDPGSGCTSPHSIDGVAFGVGTWSTSRISTVQVGQTVLDRYTDANEEITAGQHTFCPLEYCDAIVDMMEWHFCAHPFIPEYSAPTPEGIKA